MNSFMKAKTEEKKSKTSFPEELPKEAKLPLPIQTNPNSSLVVEKKDNEKLNEKLANEELEKEKKKEKEKEKKTKDNYEEETEIESESDDDDDEYKIVKIKLIPFIFTEKYEQVKGFIKDSRITRYSFLNEINNGIISDIEFKEIENRIKDRLSEILFAIDDDFIKLKLVKFNDSKFYFECYVKIIDDSFNESILYENEDDQIIKCAKRKYQKHYKDIYLKNIYGRCGYTYNYLDDIFEVINKEFTMKRVNPFTYNKNIIPFREIRTKSKDVIKTTIMKMGFVFYDVSEIKKDKD